MHKTKIGLTILALLLTGVIHASAVSVNLGSTDPGLFERVAALSQYGIENWTNPESPIYDPAVLKAYGKVPPIHNATQMNEFAEKLRSVRENSWDEIDFYPSGSVVLYGSGPLRGYFLVELYDDGRGKKAYTESDTREIYDIIDKYALKAGLKDVPVAFTLINNTRIVGFLEFPVYMYDIEDESTDNNISQEPGIADSTLSNTNAFQVPVHKPFDENAIENIKIEPYFIAARGSLPEMKDNAEKAAWVDSIYRCYLDLPGMKRYFTESGGPVSFYRDSGGYIEVALDTSFPERINEATIDEIYQVISDRGEEEGINEIPVIFIGVHDKEVDENTAIILSGKQPNTDRKAQQAPGFTLIVLVLSLLFSGKIRRR